MSYAEHADREHRFKIPEDLCYGYELVCENIDGQYLAIVFAVKGAHQFARLTHDRDEFEHARNDWHPVGFVPQAAEYIGTYRIPIPMRQKMRGGKAEGPAAPKEWK